MADMSTSGGVDKRNGRSGDPKTIIISRTDKIGDFVVSIPSYATARAMFPRAKIVALVSKFNRILAENVAVIDEVVCRDDYSDMDQLAAKLKSLKPDVFVALVSDNSISRLAVKSGAPRRIGPRSKLWSFFHYNHGIRQHRSLCEKSEAAYNLDLIAHIDPQRFAEVGEHFCPISFSAEDDACVTAYLKQEQLEGRDFVLVNPFTGGSGANMTPVQYGEVLAAILQRGNGVSAGADSGTSGGSSGRTASRAFGGESGGAASGGGEGTTGGTAPVEVVILAMPEHKERAGIILKQIPEEFSGRVHCLFNEKSLLVAAALVSRCKVFIGASTGITQIAGNYHKPTLCFYSSRISNSHQRWQLYGDKQEVPFSFMVENLDPKTKTVVRLPEDIKEGIIATTLKFFYQDEAHQ